MATKQSLEDRRRRLEQGCCPVHGLDMGQVDKVVEEREGGWWREVASIVECPRKGCGVRATQVLHDDPAVLLPEWMHLLGPEAVAADQQRRAAEAAAEAERVRLERAAPALLDALRAIAEQRPAAADPDDAWSLLQHCLHLADLAIAKAEGR